LIVNGAGRGFAGWDTGEINNRTHSASLPQKIPLLYDPKAPLGSRFTRMAEAKIIRVYHSTATLIPDGTVFVAGSNPNPEYCGINTCEYPTEYRVEIFKPAYLFKGIPRPVIKSIKGIEAFNSLTSIQVKYGEAITITMDLNDSAANITAALIHPGFASHSLHMSSRYVSLRTNNQVPIPSGYS
ncbi:33039_t:CDS:2, partial [Racocetra persica]